MIYTVVLNSSQSEQVDNIDYYYIDWSFLREQKKYKVSFSFTSGKATLTNDDVTQIFINFTGSPNTYEVSSSRSSWQQVSNFIGVVYPVQNSGVDDCRLCATATDNPPIFLNNRPSNNKFAVYLYNMAKVIVPVIDYMLILSFEEYE